MNNPINASLSILPQENLIEILLALDDLEDITKACNSSTIFARVCKDDYFWKLRYQQDFGFDRPSEEMLKGEMPWKKYYQLAIGSGSFLPFSAGHKHLGVIDQNGQLYIWGSNQNGQLGNGTTSSSPVMVPQVVLNDVRRVSCGFSMTGAVTNDGNVYTWGLNFKGRLGIDSYDNYIVSEPTLVKLPSQKKARNINISNTSSIVLTKDGEVYVWGQLSLFLYVGAPIKLDLPDNDNKVIDIATGSRAFAVVTQKGNLYMWGDNRHYLYLSKNWTNKASRIYNSYNPGHNKFVQPALIPFSKPIRQISMGDNYFGIVTRNGELWMAGSNYVHQIGEYTPDKEEAKFFGKLVSESRAFSDETAIPTLIPIKLPSPVLYFNGRWGTSLVKLKDGRVLMWGDNSSRQITEKDYKMNIGPYGMMGDIEIPKPIEINLDPPILYTMAGGTIRLDNPILYIMAGGTFTAAITADDYINLWGDGLSS